MLGVIRRMLFLSSLCILMLGIAAPAAQAQSTPRLATLLIDVWPEYDRPATVLVIYRGEFAPGTAVPELVKLRIPASAGEPSAIASPRAGEETAAVNQWSDLLATKKATVTRNGDWLEVTFSPLSRVFTIEFYDKLDAGAFDKNYQITWPGDLAADAVTLNVREPFGATNFQSTPALPAGALDDEGLIAHQANLGPVNAGLVLPITVKYRRQDTRTSAEALQLATPAPAPSQTAVLPAGAGSPARWGLIVAALLGLALIIAGVIWYLGAQRAAAFRPYQPPTYTRSQGRRSVRTSRPSRSRPRSVAERLPERQEDQVFCTQCGKTLNSEDTFCSRCGARVKGK